MAQAWQVRSFEQQEFVRMIADEVRERAEASDSYELFVTRFLVALLSNIGAEHPDGHSAFPVIVIPSMEILLARFRYRINQFAKVSSEKPYLWLMLFRELEPAFASWAERDYLRDQIMRPQEVFGAPSATAEVDEPRRR